MTKNKSLSENINNELENNELDNNELENNELDNNDLYNANNELNSNKEQRFYKRALSSFVDYLNSTLPEISSSTETVEYDQDSFTSRKSEKNTRLSNTGLSNSSLSESKSMKGKSYKSTRESKQIKKAMKGEMRKASSDIGRPRKSPLPSDLNKTDNISKKRINKYSKNNSKYNSKNKGDTEK